ncbi:helix-turn-helix transcriptional regulator [Reichenbachiella ulvae]|uniref:YafY family transcriptional regulator n=1 Tax=Reichenbachiella ulvae TaxID=2980104 RepID=A0ABT3CXE5_9BACT|nr:YafY family protein [Reichenbachiella ulvae]MCV9388204.1 YafY family transcriptional regulator [Reichenbachiella ulvae]
MNRIDRLTAILIQLQSKKRVPLVEIEERFEIGRRTVFRDIRALTEAGVPIGGDAAEGYFIVEGYHLPPVMLNKEEAAALLLGGKLLAPKADKKTYRAFEEALLKIKAVLRYSDKDYLQTLEDKVQVLQFRHSSDTEDQDRFFPDIQKAVAGHLLVDMLYYSNYSESINQRKVAPLGLVYYNDNWHIIGFCFLRKQIRDFRTTRVRELMLLEETFDPCDYPNYDDFLKEQLSRFDVEEVTVEIRNDITRFISDAKYNYGFVSEKKGQEWTEMKFVIPDHHFFVHWMMMHGKYGRILSPPSLIKRAKELSREIFEHYL